jgi:hypothetical protein
MPSNTPKDSSSSYFLSRFIIRLLVEYNVKQVPVPPSFSGGTLADPRANRCCVIRIAQTSQLLPQSGDSSVRQLSLPRLATDKHPGRINKTPAQQGFFLRIPEPLGTGQLSCSPSSLILSVRIPPQGYAFQSGHSHPRL